MFARYFPILDYVVLSGRDRCVERQKREDERPTRARRYRWNGKIDRGIGRSIDEPSTSHDKHRRLGGLNPRRNWVEKWPAATVSTTDEDSVVWYLSLGQISLSVVSLLPIYVIIGDTAINDGNKKKNAWVFKNRKRSKKNFQIT